MPNYATLRVLAILYIIMTFCFVGSCGTSVPSGAICVYQGFQWSDALAMLGLCILIPLLGVLASHITVE
jgi:hypothetical protein